MFFTLYSQLLFSNNDFCISALLAVSTYLNHPRTIAHEDLAEDEPAVVLPLQFPVNDKELTLFRPT